MHKEPEAKEVIYKKLLELSKALDKFEQTTHGCIGPFTIDAVCSALSTAYKNPNSFTISNLAQYIEGLKRE